MSANIPAAVAEYQLAAILQAAGLVRIHQGKVRDTWEIPDSEFLLVIATDRISIFDFVLNALIPKKGEILTATTVFWLTKILVGTKHHLIASGARIDSHLPKQLRGNSELQKRAIVVKRCDMKPREFIYRGYLTGGGLDSYRETGSLFGQPLPPGLQDGSKLDQIQFTPTTKAEVGHDMPLAAEDVRNEYPKESALGAMVYEMMADHAYSRGIIMADTKEEFGDYNGVPTLADEIGTPDCSRLWDLRDWKTRTDLGETPNPLDKQFVRNWGKTLEINKRNPTNPIDLAYVHNLVVPKQIIHTTLGLYNSIFSGLTECSVEYFQKNYMGIR